MIHLIIARHGNNFDPGDTVLRMGGRTDFPLSSSGRKQAEKLGIFLHQQFPTLDQVYTSQLKRTQETAAILLRAYDRPVQPIVNPEFDEIDYGPDEGKSESEVLARLGQAAISAWEEEGLIPQGWKVNTRELEQHWVQFGKQIVEGSAKTVLVVTSNGIARYIRALLPASEHHKLMKLATGAFGVLQWDQSRWSAKMWNVRP